jgi:endonuclease/exonuclease/phosphatase (EEP) superfamily protein YafD
VLARALLTDIHWVLLVVLVALVLTAVFSISHDAGLALAQDALPLLLVLSWITLAVALLKGAWILAIAAGLVCVYHLYLVVPRMRADRIPRWARDAPAIQIVISNVYVDNGTPGLLARELIDTNADVIIITEWNPSFANEFDALGGRTLYPHRMCEEMDGPDYAVCVLSRLDLQATSEVIDLRSLRLVKASVVCDRRSVSIMGLNATAAVDPGGYKEWKAQLEALTEALPSFEPPFVIAGDLNTTEFRPEYRRLLRHGVCDAHDALGKGMSRSFQLAATGLLATPGSLVRLDHALLSRDVKPVEVEDLDACGSDHRPFRLVLAIRQDGPESRRRFPRRRSSRRDSTQQPSPDPAVPSDPPEQPRVGPRTRDR